MAKRFDWSTLSEPGTGAKAWAWLRERFPSTVRGAAEWQALVDSLHRAWKQNHEPGASFGDDFFDAISRIEPIERSAPGAPAATPTDCLFVSHRQVDVDPARRVACLAEKRGWDVWLDVDDPLLAIASGSPPAVRGILIAATIEIALLNCTRLVALLTPNSKGSQWIPYEFGRAKAKKMHSNEVCSYLFPGVIEPEYAQLARIDRSEASLCAWLSPVVLAKRSDCKHYASLPKSD